MCPTVAFVDSRINSLARDKSFHFCFSRGMEREPFAFSWLDVGIPQTKPGRAQGLFSSRNRIKHHRFLKVTDSCLSFFFFFQKPGKWCAMHVHIAWQIYHHQQKVKVSAWTAWTGGEGHRAEIREGGLALTWALLCHGQCLGKVTHTTLSRNLISESWYQDEKLKAESQQSVWDVLEPDSRS